MPEENRVTFVETFRRDYFLLLAFCIFVGSRGVLFLMQETLEGIQPPRAVEVGRGDGGKARERHAQGLAATAGRAG